MIIWHVILYSLKLMSYTASCAMQHVRLYSLKLMSYTASCAMQHVRLYSLKLMSYTAACAMPQFVTAAAPNNRCVGLSCLPCMDHWEHS
jgi:hypothetical protein